jgi:hypothetical protein
MSLKTDIYKSKTDKKIFLKKVNFINTNEKRVREPVTPSKGRVVGQFPSIKNNESVAWESQLELKACRIFEYSHFIESYREQPVVVKYMLNGVLRRYIPDFELICVNGDRVYIEIKPKKILEKPEEVERFIAITKKLHNEGVYFAVMTEVELDKDDIQDNIKAIHPYANMDINIDLINIIKALKNESSFSIEELLDIGFTIGTIYATITKNYLKTNLRKSLSRHSRLFIEEEQDNENNIFSCRIAPDFK